MEYRRYWSSLSSPSSSNPLTPSSDFSPTDWWLFLSPGLRLLSSRPPVPPKRHVGSLKRGLTLWDSLEVRGAADWTLNTFLEALEKQLGIRAAMVLQGSKMVYVQVMPMHAKRKVKL